MLKDEFQELLGEVLLLREQAKDIDCVDECDGCGEHAPFRKNNISVGASSIGTTSVVNVDTIINDGIEGNEEGKDA